MSIKLIATDLDGTLMAPDHLTVTKRTYDALKSSHDKGIRLAVATGRPMALIDNVISQVPFVDYIIYSNGACVYDRNEEKIIHADLIPYKKAKEIVEYFLGENVFFEIYANGRSCYQLGTESLFQNMNLPQKFIDEATKSMDGYDSLLDFMAKDGKGMEKITFYGVYEKKLENISAKLKEFGLDVCSSLPGTVEATSPTANKGSAVLGICKNMGIGADEVMTFGDAGNDCPMLDFANYSFAMENGTDECKSHAKFITSSNGEDGVAKAVEKYAL